MDTIVEKATFELIEHIKESETYKEYLRYRDKLMEKPDLYDRVNEFRDKNYEIQNTSRPEEIYEKIETLEREYGELWEDPWVGEFLNAELAFCRMIQDINMLIASEVDFIS